MGLKRFTGQGAGLGASWVTIGIASSCRLHKEQGEQGRMLPCFTNLRVSAWPWSTWPYLAGVGFGFGVGVGIGFGSVLPFGVGCGAGVGLYAGWGEQLQRFMDHLRLR